MNWKQLNEKYPLAFLEWAKGVDNGFDTIVDVFADNIVAVHDSKEDLEYFIPIDNLAVWVIPYHFDTLGIHVNACFIGEGAKVLRELVSKANEKPYAVSVNWGCGWDSDETFPDRLSATIAGIEKAFEIREEQLRLALEK